MKGPVQSSALECSMRCGCFMDFALFKVCVQTYPKFSDATLLNKTRNFEFCMVLYFNDNDESTLRCCQNYFLLNFIETKAASVFTFMEQSLTPTVKGNSLCRAYVDGWRL